MGKCLGFFIAMKECSNIFTIATGENCIWLSPILIQHHFIRIALLFDHHLFNTPSIIIFFH